MLQLLNLYHHFQVFSDPILWQLRWLCIVSFASSVSSLFAGPVLSHFLTLHRRFLLTPYCFFFFPYGCIFWLRIIVFLASYRCFLLFFLIPYCDIFLAPYRRFFPVPYCYICWLRIVGFAGYISSHFPAPYCRFFLALYRHS